MSDIPSNFQVELPLMRYSRKKDYTSTVRMDDLTQQDAEKIAAAYSNLLTMLVNKGFHINGDEIPLITEEYRR